MPLEDGNQHQDASDSPLRTSEGMEFEDGNMAVCAAVLPEDSDAGNVPASTQGHDEREPLHVSDGPATARTSDSETPPPHFSSRPLASGVFSCFGGQVWPTPSRSSAGGRVSFLLHCFS